MEEPLASDSDNHKKICRTIKESKVWRKKNGEAHELHLTHSQCNLD